MRDYPWGDVVAAETVKLLGIAALVGALAGAILGFAVFGAVVAFEVLR